jgi:catechol 2,3-dioxygenase-like lactoylglutathione lyase family enzyme
MAVTPVLDINGDPAPDSPTSPEAALSERSARGMCACSVAGMAVLGHDDDIRDQGGSSMGGGMGQQPGPLGADAAVTHILVVAHPAASRDFWVNVLGAELYREYGGTSVVLKFAGTWLLLVSGGGPTADKPGVTFAPPPDPDQVSHAITVRVADCHAAYAELTARGAAFLTAPHDWGGEIRCFLRDPDGHLVEISESVSA